MDKHKVWAPTIVAPKSVVIDHERTDEANFQCEFNGVSGRRELPNQCPRTYEGIQYSYRPCLQKKSREKNSTVGTHH